MKALVTEKNRLRTVDLFCSAYFILSTFILLLKIFKGIYVCVCEKIGYMYLKTLVLCVLYMQ